MRLRMTLAYDGTAFHGWAKQAGLRTVQGDLEGALETIFRCPINTVVAGRTDAGVHAENQVAHVDIPEGSAATADPERLVRRINSLLSARYLEWRRPEVARGHLPAGNVTKGDADVVVKSVAVVPPSFDARFAAGERHYRYKLVDRVSERVPTRRTTEWWFTSGPLSVDRMREASRDLIGEHDFLSFCKPREGASTIRTLRRVDVSREGGGITVEVSGDAFCHHMVRSIVGALVEVGRGVRTKQWVERLIDEPSRDHGVVVAPARGLTLVSVSYPSQDQWETQAARSRVLRTLTPSD